jgi:hypothetical protein
MGRKPAPQRSAERRVSSALRRAQSEPRGAQTPHELAAVHLLGAGCDYQWATLLWHVVMVALEPSAWDPHRRSKCVELRQRLVRYEMTPAAIAPPPPRLIDKHGHTVQPRTGRPGGGHAASCLVAPRPPPGDTDQR